MSRVIECFWNKTLENKLIAKEHQIIIIIDQMPNKWTDYKILELKYGNTKLLENTKHNQVKLVLAVFLPAYLYQYSVKLY